ncbi:hypothetical protein PoB_004046000 [Plakobranchus ocellatus]|uniref:Uncharacterized protein n=1 Tax=Plakobranchus ocellatus TaxID=259542 RepID=A0AAV4B302_9GAST|nr:hypothetical protein PoB_004046000 [Plakobranchus ocellatus]
MAPHAYYAKVALRQSRYKWRHNRVLQELITATCAANCPPVSPNDKSTYSHQKVEPNLGVEVPIAWIPRGSTYQMGVTTRNFQQIFPMEQTL